MQGKPKDCFRGVGKKATHFIETAVELENSVLTNKTYQHTRFVRSLLRGLTAALRNLPTLVNVYGKDFEEAALNFENTKAKELKSTLGSLMKSETLFFTIGLCQILEIYCEPSLESQHASHFLIQVCSLIEDINYLTSE